jgi:hypothetical protein
VSEASAEMVSGVVVCDMGTAILRTVETTKTQFEKGREGSRKA